MTRSNPVAAAGAAAAAGEAAGMVYGHKVAIGTPVESASQDAAAAGKAAAADHLAALENPAADADPLADLLYRQAATYAPGATAGTVDSNTELLMAAVENGVGFGSALEHFSAMQKVAVETYQDVLADTSNTNAAELAGHAVAVAYADAVANGADPATASKEAVEAGAAAASGIGDINENVANAFDVAKSVL